MNTVKNLICKINIIPMPLRFGLGSYILASALYTGSCSYSDAQNALHDYRDKNTNKLSSEWLAVKYGAYTNFGENFWKSIIWPWSLTSDIIPGLVLLFNPKPKEN
jgi:hypothetical protein